MSTEKTTPKMILTATGHGHHHYDDATLRAWYCDEDDVGRWLVIVGRDLALGIGATLHSYAAMIVAPSFILPMVPLMLCFAAQGAYLVGAPFIFIHVLGLSPAAFGTTSLVPVAALFSGRSLCLAAQKRGSLPAAFSAGAAIAFLGGLLLVAVHRLGWVSPVPILLSCGVFCLGFGILLPIAMKAGLSAFPNRVGTSSALFGCLNLAASAVGSVR